MKKTIVCFFALCFITGSSYALDWPAMHEKADKLTADQAKVEAAAASDSLEALYVLGLSCLNEHKDDQAAAAFQKMFEADSSSIEAKWGLAEVNRRKYKTNEAKNALWTLTQSEPGFAPAFISLAYIKYNLQEYDEALKLSQTVIDLGKDKVDAANYSRAFLISAGSRGMLAHYGGPIAKLVQGLRVMPELKTAQKILPESAQVYFGLGAYYMLAPRLAGGDIKLAQVYLKKTVELDPGFADAYARLAQLYKAGGDEAKYNEYLEKALQIDPQNFLAADIKSGRCKYVCPE